MPGLLGVQVPMKTLLLTACLACLATFAPLAGADPELKGSLTTLHGVKILTLGGTPRENGFARGYLMAKEIQDTLGVIDVLMPAGIDFGFVEGMVLPKLVRPDPERQEMEGVIDGLKAKLGGDGLTLARIGHPLTADDLWAILAIPDLKCSAFAAWGSMTADGGLIFGRNLDYGGMGKASGGACIVVHREPERSWIDFTLSPLPDCSTAIGQDGRCAAILDANSTGAATGPANLRAFALAHFFDLKLDANPFADQAATLFRGIPILRGTNFILGDPRGGAVVAEYDSNLAKDSGVTMRQPAAGQEWIVVTNHFCARTTTRDNGDRYEKLDQALNQMHSAGTKIAGLDDGRTVISRAANHDTLLTLVYWQSQRTVSVSFTDGRTQAAEMPPITFTLDELFNPKP